MNKKLIQILALAVIMVGCSKKEDSAAPPPSTAIVSAPQASSVASNQAELETTKGEQFAANVPTNSA